MVRSKAEIPTPGPFRRDMPVRGTVKGEPEVEVFGTDRESGFPVTLRPTEEAIQAVEAELEARAREREQQTNTARGREIGLSGAAYSMRERRANPETRRRELLTVKAKDAARRQLAKNHPDELLALTQIERQKLGLPPMVPRGYSSRPATPSVDPPTPVKRVTPAAVILHPAISEVQERCRHNQGLQKLAYGVFCLICGKKVR